MIYLYDKNETTFTHRGIGSLIDCKSCVVTEYLNGLYDLQMLYPVEGKLYEQIEPLKILKVKNVNGYQLFRIQKITKSIDSILVEATHIFYDLIGNFVYGTYIENLNGQSAITKLFNSVYKQTPFSVSSNIQKLASVKLIRRSLLECIFEGDVSLLARWGGEIERDNYNIRWNTRIGADRGVTIKYAKNLRGIEFTTDYTDLITTVVPQGYDGLVLPEKYVDSPIKNQFIDTPRVKEIQYPEIKSKKLTKNDEYAMEHDRALQKLREFAAKEFSEKNKDKPVINCVVDFIDLSQTDEYKDYAVLERVFIGDTVRIVYPQQHIDLFSRVIGYKWDVLQKKYTYLEVGEASKGVLTSISNLEKRVNTISIDTETLLTKAEQTQSTITSEATNAVTQMINAGFGGHVRISSDEIKIMDTNSEETAKKVWRWNLAGLAFSNTGVNGPWLSAMANDGRLVQEFIHGLKISANMLEAGAVTANHLSVTAKEVLRDGLATTEQLENRIRTVEQQVTPEGITNKIETVLESKKKELSTVIRSDIPPTDTTKLWFDNVTKAIKEFRNNEWLEIVDFGEVVKSIEKTMSDLYSTVAKEETLQKLQNELDAEKEKVNSLNDYKRTLDNSFEIFKQNVESFQNDTEKLIKIVKIGENGIRISQEGNPLELGLDNGELAFYDGGAKVANFTNKKLIVTNVNVTSSLQIGNYVFEEIPGTPYMTAKWIGGTY